MSKTASHVWLVVGAGCWLRTQVEILAEGSLFLYLGLSAWLLELLPNMVARYQAGASQEAKAEAVDFIRPGIKSYMTSRLLQSLSQNKSKG